MKNVLLLAKVLSLSVNILFLILLWIFNSSVIGGEDTVGVYQFFMGGYVLYLIATNVVYVYVKDAFVRIMAVVLELLPLIIFYFACKESFIHILYNIHK